MGQKIRFFGKENSEKKLNYMLRVELHLNFFLKFIKFGPSLYIGQLKFGIPKFIHDPVAKIGRFKLKRVIKFFKVNRIIKIRKFKLQKDSYREKDEKKKEEQNYSV